MSSNSEAFIVDAIRTPIGKFGGGLASVRPDDLAALAIKTLFERQSAVPKEAVRDVIFGCANQAGEDNRNVARMASLLAGLPTSVPGETVNRLCASGMSAVIHAARALQLGEGEFYVAGGTESMSRAPFVMSKSEQAFGRKVEVFDTSIGWRFVNKKLEELYGTDSMGQTAENVAQQFNVSRDDQDSFAFGSQAKCSAAIDNERFKREIVPVSVPQRKGEPRIVEQDEFPRPSTTLEALSGLRAAFAKNGSVTAGNASGINDGAAALLMGSTAALEKYGLKPLAKVRSWAAVGVEPRIMGMGPVDASKRALEMAGLSMNDMDVIELNEAFAAQSLACMRELGLDDKDDRVNRNGGAIAIGHPLGMSGARLIQTAALELKELSAKYALCTMCVGVGQGMACVIESAS